MSSVGTFGTFTTARLGIWASQKGLSVVGNNIANINTVGYTRQNLEQVSLKTGGADRYAAQNDVHVGQGVLCTGVSQIRDPYLDIRYRTEMSSVGAMDAKLDGLNGLEAILDEVGKGTDGYGVIAAQFYEFMDSLERLSENAGAQSNDTLARASADSLAKLFQKYAKELNTLYNNQTKSFKQDVADVNEILTSIRDLNTAIRKSEIHGDNALEMRDDRNKLIDELSKYVKIDVRYSMEDIGAGKEVEKLTILLGDANPDHSSKTDQAVLVDGIYAAQFAMPKANPDYDPDAGEGIAQFKYLDENGNGTNDMLEALMEPDENFNLSLSKLLDSKGREWKDVTIVKKPINKPADPDKVTTITDTDDTLVEQAYELGSKNGIPIWYEVTTTTKKTVPIEKFDDNDLYGSLQASRELLTEAGEFSTTDVITAVDEKAATKRGIPYYQKSLDLLARTFADTYNRANYGCLVDENGNYLKNTGTAENPVYTLFDENLFYEADDGTKVTFRPHQNMNAKELEALGVDPDGTPEEIQDGINQYLKANDGAMAGGNLFSIRNDTDQATDPASGDCLITASNISISESWSTGAVHIVTTFSKPFSGEVNNTTQGSNVNHMITLMDEKRVFNPQDLVDDAESTHLFEGSFEEMLDKMFTVLGSDKREASTMLDTYYESALELDTSRDGVSGVDLNDEAMSLMQYSKSLNAAYRLMTTIDEALDRLINNTGVVGR